MSNKTDTMARTVYRYSEFYASYLGDHQAMIMVQFVTLLGDL